MRLYSESLCEITSRGPCHMVCSLVVGHVAYCANTKEPSGKTVMAGAFSKRSWSL